MSVTFVQRALIRCRSNLIQSRSLFSTGRSLSEASEESIGTKHVQEEESPPPPPSTDESKAVRRKINRRDFRFMFPEFLPDPNYLYRNAVVEKITRKDMLKRRQVNIPIIEGLID